MSRVKKSLIILISAVFFLYLIYFVVNLINTVPANVRIAGNVGPKPGQESKLKKLTKHDRMDLAMQLEVEKTKDPALGYIPRERLFMAYQYAEELRLQIYSPSGKLYKNSEIRGVADIDWTQHGPNNIGGRSRAVMFDPNDANHKKVWAGAVSGGLWYSEDITASAPTWTKVDDFWDNIAISCIAYDPSNTQVFYVGTGEGWYNFDAVRGAGIWKTTDGGSNWSQLSGTDNSTFYYVQKIVIHPTSGDVYAATRSGGIQKSTDGGSSWTKVLGSGTGASTDRAADLEIGADNTIYAAMGIFSTDGVYSSTTGNSGGWTKRNTGANGFPTTDIQRIELATAPSDANVIYALVQGSGSTIENLYRSSDKGASWSTITTPVNVDGSGNELAKAQAWYNLIAAVHPTDPNTVYAGGVDFFKTTDGGTNWTQLSHWNGGYGKPYLHADQHAISFRPDNNSEVVIGNDGGIWYTDDAGVTFTDQSNGYITAQYYSCAVHPTENNYFYLGGAQDNGTHKFDQGGLDDIDEVIGGDGGFCFISTTDPDIQIGAYTQNNWYLSTNGGESFSRVHSESDGRFINPADYDAGADILYASMDSESQIKRLRNFSGSITEDNITGLSLTGETSAFRVSPYTSNLLFAGTESGKVYTLTNANATPTVTDISGTSLPGGYISCIEIGASDNQILVTLSNYGVTSVWETTDGGSNWNNKEGNLPDMPVRWALYNPLDRSEVMLATEVGVWSTTDITASSPAWSPSNSGLANVRVDMLKLRSADNFVIAGTHGRGMFSSDAFTTEQALFHASDTLTWPGDEIQFTDDSYKATSWFWNFGDATTSTLQNPTQIYYESGRFTVSLDINGGTSTETKADYIHALGNEGTPYAPADGGDFESNPDDFGSISLTGGINLWERGTPSNAINNTASGTNVWKTDLDADIPSTSTFSCALLSPKFNFTASGTYYLKFNFRMEIYYSNAPGEAYMEYSTDRGVSWSRLGGLQGTDANAVQNWYNRDETYNGGSNSFTGPCWWLNESSYVQAIYDVSALQGNLDVRFRLVYRNDGNWGSSEFDGFAVDDFEVDGPPNEDDSLPVTLSAFAADLQRDQIKLKWSTESEIENRAFILEKSDDGMDFFQLTQIPGHGNSSAGHAYEYVDDAVEIGNTYYYVLSNIDFNGTVNVYDTLRVNFTTEALDQLAPLKFALHPNFPNPFNPSTNIRFDLPYGQAVYKVDIAIYNVLGQKVRRLISGEYEPGRYSEIWDGKNDAGRILSSGTYYLVIRAGDYIATNKMLYLR